MKPACVKTLKRVFAWGALVTITYMIIKLLQDVNVLSDCKSGSPGCTKEHIVIVGAILGAWLFLIIAYVKIREALICCFPVACGHRRCIFTGRSSKPLQEILLLVDNKIPTQEKLQEFRDKALLYLNDIKIPLEQKMTRTTFQFIFSGSAVERFGIPLMMSENNKNNSPCCKAFSTIDALYTDLDVMFCSSVDKASFIGHGNILIEPLVTESEGFLGYAKLTSLTPGYEGQCISSKLIRDKAEDAVGNASPSHLPSKLNFFGLLKVTPEIKLDSKGPAIKIHIAHRFDADITICIQCSEWPSMSDWPSRPRYWPSVTEAQKIISLGCHLVAKSAPNDKEETSWRFSFSLAEVELSKLVPETARKCFLALKIILKDHLQPVVPMISSYHLKTIFLNTLEKVPVSFWVESNIEECFLTLLAELRDALLFRNCPHHWFSSINLFGKETSCFCIKTKRLQRLAKKVQTILNDPAPFIFDRGCFCLSPCCLRVSHYKFTRRTNEQFLAEYEEFMLSVDGHPIARAQDHVGSGNKLCQPSEASSLRCEAQLDPSLYSLIGYHSKEITIEPDQVVASIPPTHEQGPSICTDGVKQGAKVCPNKAHGHAIAGTRHPVDPSSHTDKLPVGLSPRCEAEVVPSSYSSGNHSDKITTEPEQLMACLPLVPDVEQDLSFCSGEAEDSLPILVPSPLSGWLTRLHQYFKLR